MFSYIFTTKTGIERIPCFFLRKRQLNPIFTGWFGRACRKGVANIVANLVQRSTLFCEPVDQMVGPAFDDDKPSVRHRFQVALQRPPIDLGAKTLEILNGQAAMFQDVGEALPWRPESRCALTRRSRRMACSPRSLTPTR